MTKALLDNSVLDLIAAANIGDDIKYCITTRQRNDNQEYLKKYSSLNLEVIPNIARLDHSILDGGEVFASDEVAKLANTILALAANQSKITAPSVQTNHNQRDDADIVIAAIMNKVDYLVSDDKKFMLRDDIIRIAKENGVKTLSAADFIAQYGA